MNIRKIKKKPFGLVLRPGEIVLRKHGGKKKSRDTALYYYLKTAE